MSITGEQPGIKNNDMMNIIITKSTNVILFNYRELRKLRFPNEGKNTI